MKKKNRVKYLLLCLFTTAIAACSGEHLSKTSLSEGVMAIPHVRDQWTYFSLVRGAVMGQCGIRDTAAQRQWKQRTDWDIAICNGMLRTNSGASGIGQGGIHRTNAAYDAINDIVAPQYVIDKDSLVW